MFIIKSSFFIYRYFLSPLISCFGIQCRYQESCSSFTFRQIQEKGFLTGTILGIKRILSCSPWSNINE